MLFLLLLIIIVLLIFLSNNIYLQISNIIKTCAVNDSSIIDINTICESNFNNISSSFSRCIIEKINKLNKEKTMLNTILEYIRNIPSGQVSIFKKITGIDSLFKVKGMICGLMKNKLIDKESLVKEVLAESEVDAEYN